MLRGECDHTPFWCTRGPERAPNGTGGGRANQGGPTRPYKSSWNSGSRLRT